MSGYCKDCGNTQCICAEIAVDEANRKAHSLDRNVRAQEACGGRCGVAECTLDTEGRPMREQRWDIDPVTGEAREWRLIAKEEIEGSEWAFPKGKRLRGFKDYRDGDWCVYAPGQYMESRLFGVPETLLEIVRPVNRPNDQAQ